MPSNRIVRTNGAYWDFIAIHGLPDLPGMSQKRLQKQGVSGYAFKDQGYHAEPTPLSMVTLATSSAHLQTTMGGLKNLQGQLVRVWSPQGIYFDVMVERIKVDRAQRVIGCVWQGVPFISPYKVFVSATVTYPYGGF